MGSLFDTSGVGPQENNEVVSQASRKATLLNLPLFLSTFSLASALVSADPTSPGAETNNIKFPERMAFSAFHRESVTPQGDGRIAATADLIMVEENGVAVGPDGNPALKVQTYPSLCLQLAYIGPDINGQMNTNVSWQQHVLTFNAADFSANLSKPREYNQPPPVKHFSLSLAIPKAGHESFGAAYTFNRDNTVSINITRQSPYSLGFGQVSNDPQRAGGETVTIFRFSL